jgi:hypothetical protein
VSGSFFPNPASQAACSPTCTIGGDIVINNSPGAANNGFVSADVTTTGFSGPTPPRHPFTASLDLRAYGPNPPFNQFTLLELTNPESVGMPTLDQILGLVFESPTIGSFVGYTGAIWLPLVVPATQIHRPL